MDRLLVSLSDDTELTNALPGSTHFFPQPKGDSLQPNPDCGLTRKQHRNILPAKKNDNPLRRYWKS